MASSLDDCIKKASELAENLPQDVFVYNGAMKLGRDLECIETVYANTHREECLLFLTTHGGDPDAAYKIARYFQEKYKKFAVLVSGRCKSAGTLVALGAHELVFTPYGELGPLDIQMSKVDRFDQMQSGLTITDSLNTLEERALDRFYKMVSDYISANNGLLSFASASKAASDFVTQLYAPVFSRIDPEEVGAKARSMRIATDYGRRLAVKSQNLRPNTLATLSETYSSHSFVIDHQEAAGLFVRVRVANETEKKIVAALERYARFEVVQGGNILFRTLSKPPVKAEVKGKSNGQADKRGSKPRDGANPPGPTGAAKSTPGKGRSTGRRALQGRANGAAHPR